MNIQLEHPYILAFALLVLAALVSWFLYKRNNLSIPKPVFYGLRVLRTLSVFALFVLLLNPFIEHIERTLSKPVLLVGIDNSKSLQKEAANINALLTSLEEKVRATYDIKKLSITKDVQFADSLNFKGTRSNLGGFVQYTNQYSTDNVAGALLLSDGIYNDGFSPNTQIEVSTMPISTVLFGDTSKYIDVSIADVKHNASVRKGNETTVRLSIKTSNIPDLKTQVFLKEKGRLVGKEMVEISNSGSSTELTFILNPLEVGLHSYIVSIPVINGELNTINNTASFSIDVVESQSSILVVYDVLHPDLGIFASVYNQTLNYSVQTVAVKDLTKSQIEKANLLITRLQTKQGQNTFLSLSADIAKPCLYMLALGQRQLALAGVNLKAKGNTNFVYPDLNKNFELFLSDGLEDQFSNVPALEVPFGDYEISAAWKKLYTQNINGLSSSLALVALNKDVFPAKAMIIGSGYWRWRMNVYARTGNFNAFDGFIKKITDVLIQSGKNEPLNIEIAKRFSLDDDIESKAFLYNTLNEFVPEKEISLAIQSDSLRYQYTYISGTKNYSLRIGSLPVGTYNWQAKTILNGKTLTKGGAFIVEGFDVEMLDLGAKADVLTQLSKSTKGAFFYSAEQEALFTYLIDHKLSKPIESVQRKKSTPIDMLWFFVLLIVVTSLELFIRRQVGML